MMENGGFNENLRPRTKSEGNAYNPHTKKLITPQIQLSPSEDPDAIIPLNSPDADNPGRNSSRIDRASSSDSPTVVHRGRFSVSSPVDGDLIADPLTTPAKSGRQRLDRHKSISDQNLYETKLEIPERRRRAGSLTLVGIPPINKPSSKLYVPVVHNDRSSDCQGSNHDTVNSFADFIQVSKKKRLNNTTTTTSPFPFTKSPAKRNMRRRLVYKNGECNVTNKRIHKYKRHYLADIFTTLIDLKWRYSLAIFTGTFILTWVLFAVVWYIIGFAHKDFEEGASHDPCVAGVRDFTTAFLFSLETQHTIGYGTRAMNQQCTEAIIILMLQSITGVLAQALVTGMIFAKLSRPKKRAETLMFSKEATISLRDGALCLMFRIGDMRSSHLIESHVRAMVIRRRVTKEGEVLPLDHQDVNLGFDDGTDRLLIIWPVIVIHKIDNKSPFWRMSQEDLERENFELIVVLEGTIESTGMTTQARTSYLPGEILWGRRLERLVTFQKEDGEYQVDYTRFDSTVPVDTPSCSAKDLAAQKQDTDDSSEEEEFTLLRADSIQTSDTEESESLLRQDGGVAVQMYDMEHRP